MHVREASEQRPLEIVRPGELFQVFGGDTDPLLDDAGSEIGEGALLVRKKLEFDGYPDIDIGFVTYAETPVDRAFCLDPIEPSNGYQYDIADYFSTDREQKLGKAEIDGATNLLGETHNALLVCLVLDMDTTDYEPDAYYMAAAMEQVDIVVSGGNQGHSQEFYSEYLVDIARIMAMHDAVARLRLDVLFSNGNKYSSYPLIREDNTNIADYSYFFLAGSFPPADTATHPPGHKIYVGNAKEMVRMHAQFVITGGDDNLEYSNLPDLSTPSPTPVPA